MKVKSIKSNFKCKLSWNNRRSLPSLTKTRPKIIYMANKAIFHQDNTDQSLYHSDDSTCCVNPLNHTFPKSSFSAISTPHMKSLLYFYLQAVHYYSGVAETNRTLSLTFKLSYAASYSWYFLCSSYQPYSR